MMDDTKVKPEFDYQQQTPIGLFQGTKIRFDDLKHGKEIEQSYTKLHDIINNLDQKVAEIVKTHEDDFFFAYKDQMHEIQKELKNMKKKIDEETLKQKADEKKRILEEERDYFREEALRLDKISNEQLRTIEELKFKMKITNEEKNYYEGFVIDSKKENKALKYELLQLYKTKMDEQKKNRTSGTLQGKSFFPATRATNPDNTQSRPQTQEQGLLDFVAEDQRDLGTITTASQAARYNSQYLSKLGKSPSVQAGGMFSTQIEFKKSRGLSSQIKNRPFASPNDLIQQQVIQLQQNESEHQESIHQLKSQLEKEKINNKRLKIEYSQTNSARSELEFILLDCVNEVKKDIVKRRAQQKQQLHGKGINDIMLDQEIDYKQFSQTDKKKLFKMFIMSDQFLETIYQTTFNPTFAPQSHIKLNEQWKKDASDAQKKYSQFRNYKFINQISSQTVVRQVLQKKDLESTFNNFTQNTRNLIQKVKGDSDA